MSGTGPELDKSAALSMPSRNAKSLSQASGAVAPSLSETSLASGISVRRGPPPTPDPARLSKLTTAYQPGLTTPAGQEVVMPYTPSILDHLMNIPLRIIQRIVAALTGPNPTKRAPTPAPKIKAPQAEPAVAHEAIDLTPEQILELKNRFQLTLSDGSGQTDGGSNSSDEDSSAPQK